MANPGTDRVVTISAAGTLPTRVVNAIKNIIAGQITGKADKTALSAHLADHANPHMVTKAQLGLGNVSNTSDTSKPISTATQTAISAVQASVDSHKADHANPHQVTKAQLGLGNVDNTADISKPVSTATKAITDSLTTNLNSHVNAKNNPHAVTKAQVGLGSVDNTSDANKPISAATQTAINVVSNANSNLQAQVNSHVANTANPHHVTKAQLGLGNVDNTSDLNKPVSTATQAAINAAITGLINGAPGALDTLKELATALGNDANFAADITNQIATKVTAAQAAAAAPVQSVNGKTGAVVLDLTGASQAALNAETSRAEAAEQANATAITGKADQSALLAHEQDNSNPHNVTQAQVGLGNVNNTSDADKPVSTAAQALFDNLPNQYAAKSTQTTVETGRLSSTSLLSTIDTEIQNNYTNNGDTQTSTLITTPGTATRNSLNTMRGRGGFRVSLLGASITANNGNSTLVNNPVGGASAHGPSVLGIFAWMQMALGHPLSLLTSVSRGGDPSASIQANAAAALAPGPDWVIGHDWWINDIITGITAAQSQSTIDAIIKQCNNAGATVILTDYLPVQAYTTPAMIAQHFAMVDWLRSRQDRGFIFVPIADAVVDINTGNPLTWATYDGTHPSAKGAHALGDVLADRIGHLFRGSNARHPVCTPNTAGSTVNGNPKELVGNPMIQGTPGPSRVANLYSLSGTGTPSGAIIAATDFPLQWQRITLGSDGYAVLTIGVESGSGMTYTGPNGTLTMTPGTTKTRFQFEFRMPTDSTSGKWASISAYNYYTGAPDLVYAIQENNSNGQDVGLIPDDNMIFFAKSPEYVIPSAATAIAAAIVVYGQAGASIDVRRVSLAVTN